MWVLNRYFLQMLPFCKEREKDRPRKKERTYAHTQKQSSKRERQNEREIRRKFKNEHIKTHINIFIYIIFQDSNTTVIVCVKIYKSVNRKLCVYTHVDIIFEDIVYKSYMYICSIRIFRHTCVNAYTECIYKYMCVYIFTYISVYMCVYIFTFIYVHVLYTCTLHICMCF